MPGLPPLTVLAQESALGLESTPEAYIAHLLHILRAAEGALHETAVVWWNLGDSYGGNASTGGPGKETAYSGERNLPDKGISGSLVGIPWRFLFAAEGDGWLGRSAAVWAKGVSGQGAVEDRVDQAAQAALGWGSPEYERMMAAFSAYVGNCMPESVAGWRWERCRVKVRAVRSGSAAHEYGRSDVSENRHIETEKPWNEYIPCPGCAKCRDNGGYVLRRGSWRPTSSYEHWFMLAQAGYFADSEECREETVKGAAGSRFDTGKTAEHQQGRAQQGAREEAAGRNLRNVLAISTSSSSLAYCPACQQLYNAKNGPRTKGQKCPTCGHKLTGHYAGYNRAIIRPWIASTPTAVCGACWQPWARVVERGDYDKSTTRGTQPWALETGQRDNSGGLPHRVPTTLGFRPTCACGAESRPAVICDPFAGTGTTAIEALAQGRDVILIDASAEYCEIAAQNVRYNFPQPELLPATAKLPLDKGGELW